MKWMWVNVENGKIAVTVEEPMRKLPVCEGCWDDIRRIRSRNKPRCVIATFNESDGTPAMNASPSAEGRGISEVTKKK